MPTGIFVNLHYIYLTICFPYLVDYEQPKIGYLSDNTFKSQLKKTLHKDALHYKIKYFIRILVLIKRFHSEN